MKPTPYLILALLLISSVHAALLTHGLLQENAAAKPLPRHFDVTDEQPRYDEDVEPIALFPVKKVSTVPQTRA